MKFDLSFDVRFCEADRHSRLTPVALFNYLQETAVGHGDAVGMDDAAFSAMGYAWMMNRLHMEITRYPLRRETVRVQTWGSNLHGLFAIREWIVTDALGERIARATARWIIIHVPRRKIIKLPDVIAEHYGEHPDRAIDDPFDRVSPVEGGMYERRFHVRLSELDTNHHANSASYIDWCLEAVPGDVLEASLPRSIEITFKKESKLGDALVARSVEAPANDPGERVFEHAVRLEGDDTLLSMGRSVWRRF